MAKLIRTDRTVIAEDESKTLLQLVLENKADLSWAYLSSAILRGADLSGAKLDGAILDVANLGCADLKGANLRGAILRRADLSGANLDGAILSGANLTGADLKGAYLCRVDLSWADLGGADLSGAKLDGVILSGANLGCAILSGANLAGANLDGANLVGAKLVGARGVDQRRSIPLMMLFDQPGPIRAYKLVKANGEGPFSGGIVYKIGETFEAEADTDPSVECGKGINLATLDWCLKEYTPGYRILVAEFTAEDIAAIPDRTDGKFRVHRCKIVGEKEI